MNRKWLALVVVLALLSLGGVYKWVDDKGVTHYGETPPPGAGREVRIDPTPPEAADAFASRKQWQELDRELEERRRERERADADEAQRRLFAERLAAARRAACLQARHDLEVLRLARPVYQVNERGERVYLQDRDRPRAIAENEARVKELCDGA